MPRFVRVTLHGRLDTNIDFERRRDRDGARIIELREARKGPRHPLQTVGTTYAELKRKLGARSRTYVTRIAFENKTT